VRLHDEVTKSDDDVERAVRAQLHWDPRLDDAAVTVERSFLFVSSADPEAARRAVDASPIDIDLAVISPSTRARATAVYAARGRWVFTVDEPLLVKSSPAESGADVLARFAEALRGLDAYDSRALLVVLDLLGSGAFALDEAGLTSCAESLGRALAAS